MTATTPTSSPARTVAPALGRLWFGIAAAPAAWTVAELVGYVLVARTCEPGAYPLPPQGVMGARLWMESLAVVTTLVAVAGLYVAIANFRGSPHQTPRSEPYHRVRGDVTRDPDAPLTRARFMAMAGVLVSAAFLLGTVLFALPSLMVNGCVQTR